MLRCRTWPRPTTSSATSNACFMDDPVGVKNTDIIGEDNYIWANDYPHWESTWPKSHEYIARNFEGISDEIKRKITRENAMRLFNIRLDGD